METKNKDSPSYEKTRRIWNCGASDCSSPHSRLASEAAKPVPIGGDASGLDNGRSADQRSAKCDMPRQSGQPGSKSWKSECEHFLSRSPSNGRVESHRRLDPYSRRPEDTRSARSQEFHSIAWFN